MSLPAAAVAAQSKLQAELLQAQAGLGSNHRHHRLLLLFQAQAQPSRQIHRTQLRLPVQLPSAASQPQVQGRPTSQNRRRQQRPMKLAFRPASRFHRMLQPQAFRCRCCCCCLLPAAHVDQRRRRRQLAIPRRQSPLSLLGRTSAARHLLAAVVGQRRALAEAPDWPSHLRSLAAPPRLRMQRQQALQQQLKPMQSRLQRALRLQQLKSHCCHR